MIRLRRCTLRPFILEDAAALLETSHHPSVKMNMEDKWPGFSNIEETENFIRLNQEGWPPTRLVAERNGIFIGWIGMDEKYPGQGSSVGYAIPSQQGMGAGVECLPAMAHYGFEVLALKQIFSINMPWNKPMKRILEHSGYRYCGQVEEGVYGGVPCMQDLYIVLPETLKRPRVLEIDWQALVDTAPMV